MVSLKISNPQMWLLKISIRLNLFIYLLPTHINLSIQVLWYRHTWFPYARTWKTSVPLRFSTCKTNSSRDIYLYQLLARSTNQHIYFQIKVYYISSLYASTHRIMPAEQALGFGGSVSQSKIKHVLCSTSKWSPIYNNNINTIKQIV